MDSKPSTEPINTATTQPTSSSGIQFFPIASNSTSIQHLIVSPKLNPKLNPETYHVSAPAATLRPISTLTPQPPSDIIPSKPIAYEPSQFFTTPSVQRPQADLSNSSQALAESSREEFNPTYPANVNVQPYFSNTIGTTSAIRGPDYLSPQLRASDRLKFSRTMGQFSSMDSSLGPKYNRPMTVLSPQRNSILRNSYSQNERQDSQDEIEQDAKILSAKKDTDQLLKNLMMKYGLKSPEPASQNKDTSDNRPTSVMANSSTYTGFARLENYLQKVGDTPQNQFYNTFPSYSNPDRMFPSNYSSVFQNLEEKNDALDSGPRIFAEIASPEGPRAFKDPYFSGNKENIDSNLSSLRGSTQLQFNKDEPYGKDIALPQVKPTVDSNPSYLSVPTSFKQMSPSEKTIEIDPKKVPAYLCDPRTTSKENLPETLYSTRPSETRRMETYEDEQGHYSTQSNAGTEEGHGTSEIPISTDNGGENDALMENLLSIKEKYGFSKHQQSEFGSDKVLRDVSPSVQPKSAGYKKESVQKKTVGDKENKSRWSKDYSEKAESNYLMQQEQSQSPTKVFMENTMEANQAAKYSKGQIVPSLRLGENIRASLGEITNLQNQKVSTMQENVLSKQKMNQSEGEEFQDFTDIHESHQLGGPRAKENELIKDRYQDERHIEKTELEESNKIKDLGDSDRSLNADNSKKYNLNEEPAVKKLEELEAMKEKIGKRSVAERTLPKEYQNAKGDIYEGEKEEMIKDFNKNKSKEADKNAEEIVKNNKGMSVNRILTYGVICGIIFMIMCWLYLILEEDSDYNKSTVEVHNNDFSYLDE